VIDSISSGDIAELKKIQTPSESTRIALNCVMVILEENQGWESAQ
jgi:hypothetical protein